MPSLWADGSADDPSALLKQRDIKRATMKTFAIFPKYDVKIDGKSFSPGDQVGVVSVDDVSLTTLLGAIQFGHCVAVEIDEAQVMSLEDEDSEDDQPGDNNAVLVVEVDNESDEVKQVESFPATLDGEPSDEPSDEPGNEANNETDDGPADLVTQFVNAGLDEKTASTLVEQGVETADDIRKLLADGFDMTDLEGIGKTRAAAILAIYGN